MDDSFGQPNNPGLKIEGNTITIDTTLNVGIEQFKAHPDRRNGILSSISQTIANITGRKALPVRIEKGAVDMKIVGNEMVMGADHVQKALDWEASGAEKGSSAVFGDVARAIAKRTGTEEIEQSTRLARSLAQTFAGPKLEEFIGNSIGSFVSVAPGLTQLIEEFPGLSGPVLASYVMQADALSPHDLLTSEKMSERWRGAWTAIMAEVLSPESVGEGTYPDEDTETRVKEAAFNLAAVADPITGKIDEGVLETVMGYISELMKGATQDDDKTPYDSSLDFDADATAVPVVANKSSIGIGIDLGRAVDVKPAPPYTSIKDAPLNEVMREYLTDTRMESTMGHQSGRVNNQLSRIVTDQRVFSKRAISVEAPDACVVICIDFSGSMGKIGSGHRLDNAIELHDALVVALKELDIPYASCAYCGRGDSESHIYPLNEPFKLPGANSGTSMRHVGYTSGNGDVGAMLWSTKQIEVSGASKGAIVMLADGQVGEESAKMFRKRAAELDVSVFHVDYIDAAKSPFGGEHLKAANRTVLELARPLAQGIARVLGLDQG